MDSYGRHLETALSLVGCHWAEHFRIVLKCSQSKIARFVELEFTISGYGRGSC